MGPIGARKPAPACAQACALACALVCALAGGARAGIDPAALLEDGGAPRVRVLVGKSLRGVTVTGTDMSHVAHGSGGRRDYGGRRELRFDCSAMGAAGGAAPGPVLLASLASPTGLLGVGGLKYRGEIHVAASGPGRTCDVINELEMEHYVGVVLPKEMHSAWPLEALKAQAVAARTYALHKTAGGGVFDIENSERHQVSGHFFDATESTRRAAFETRGQVLLTRDGRLTPAFFHAKCGGSTRRPDEVWDNPVAGYRGVPCPFCRDHGERAWTRSVPRGDLARVIAWASRGGRLPPIGADPAKAAVRVEPDDPARSVLRLRVGGRPVAVKKSWFAKGLGRDAVPSNTFRARWRDGALVLEGAGRGHGVGMCQLGSLDLAARGWGHRRILAHYFPGHRLVRLYP